MKKLFYIFIYAHFFNFFYLIRMIIINYLNLNNIKMEDDSYLITEKEHKFKKEKGAKRFFLKSLCM